MSDHQEQIQPVTVFRVLKEPTSPNKTAQTFFDPRSADPSSVEYLLCYNLVGVFVDGEGRKCRGNEIRWASRATHFVLEWPLLTCFSDDMIQVTLMRICFSLIAHENRNHIDMKPSTHVRYVVGNQLK